MNVRSLNPATLPAGLSRRDFFAASAAMGAWSLITPPLSSQEKRNLKLSDHPFQLGIASGDPAADGFVIWTRLAPKPLEADGGMPRENVVVKWAIANDEKFSDLVQFGEAIARPENAHAIHVEAAGLNPDRWYFYRFEAAGETSQIGRARTLPAIDANPDRLRFAFASCQHWETGFYPTYEAMLKENLDLVFHLGDYIYEGKPVDGKPRKHAGTKEIETLDEYRLRHAQYKTDPDLQAMHAACPWFVTWDDHEFDNNCAGSISEQPKVTAKEFLERRAAAYKAYYEHMPLRRTCLPTGPDMQLYRSAKFGRLAEFFVLDTRQYRTDQPCGDGNKPCCGKELDEAATLLGEKQEQWLQKQLLQSTGTWNVLAQQVMMARVDRNPAPDMAAYSMDQWPGYEANRRRVLKFLDERKIKNPVVLAGDIHTNWVNDLLVDFDDLGSRTVGAEFVGTSLSSGGNGAAKLKDHDGVLRDNPFVKLWNAERGYVTCDVKPGAWTAHYRIATDVTKRHTPVVTRASFAVEAGKPGVQQA